MIVSVVFCACSKDAPDSTSADYVNGKRVSKITSTSPDSRQSVVFLHDTVVRFNSGVCKYSSFSYTNNNVSFCENVDLGKDEVHSNNYTVSYNDNGQLVSIAASSEETIYHLSYNPNGNISEINYTYTGGSSYKINYIWTNGLITYCAITYSGSGYTSKYRTYTWEDGNLKEVVDVWDDCRETTHYTYDDHPSYKLLLGDFSLFYYGPVGLSRNNVLSEITIAEYNSGNTYVDSATYSYRYGSDGYPISFNKNASFHIHSQSRYSERNYIEYTDGSGVVAPTIYQLTVNPSNSNNGRCYGSGFYESGVDVLIAAIADYQYQFKCWQDGNTDNPRRVVCSGNNTYIATFIQDTNFNQRGFAIGR